MAGAGGDNLKPSVAFSDGKDADDDDVVDDNDDEEVLGEKQEGTLLAHILSGERESVT